MRLFLAVAVLMLALIAYTEAQDRTFEEKMSDIGDQITGFFRGVAEKANAGIQEIGNSEAITNARTWVEKVSGQITEHFNGQ